MSSRLLLASAILLAVVGVGPSWGQDGPRRGVRIVPDAEWQQEGFDPADSRGLFVGVRTFDDPDITPVPYAVDDAVDLAHLFTAELGLVRPQRVTLCLAGEPEKRVSRERLAWLVGQNARRCSAGLTELYREIERVRSDSGPNGLCCAGAAGLLSPAAAGLRTATGGRPTRASSTSGFVS